MAAEEGEKHAVAKGFKFVGYDNFVRTNPRTDRFSVLGFHHVEFWCDDATNTTRRFSFGLGIPIASKSDLSTGNPLHASYLLHSTKSGRLLFTAPYRLPQSSTSPAMPTIPSFHADRCRAFTDTHGIAVRAIALLVEDAAVAFNTSIAHGARPAFPPCRIGEGYAFSEVHLYGNVILRYISIPSIPSHSFLPGFEDAADAEDDDMLTLWRHIDHAVGCVAEVVPAVEYVQGFTGFHEFVEFTTEDLETDETGVNGVVMANNNEDVLLLIAEPVNGANRQSQVQSFLDYNVGDGVQHVALVSVDILRTVREMRERSGNEGFEFVPPPPPDYYSRLKVWAKDVLTEEQLRDCEELGVLVDRDSEGVILQIFTKPVGDRPTMFLEVIQRIGCMTKGDDGKVTQKGGCGGFGKGNIAELFKCLEEYQKSLETKQLQVPYEWRARSSL